MNYDLSSPAKSAKRTEGRGPRSTGGAQKFGKGAPSPSRYRAVLAEECAELNVDLGLALSRRRTRALALVRYRAWRRLRVMGFSFPGIGRTAGRDHTTIITGLRSLARHEHNRRCGICLGTAHEWAGWNLCAACNEARASYAVPGTDQICRRPARRAARMWPKARAEVARQLWERGLSTGDIATEIALRFGVTVSPAAVCAMLWRLRQLAGDDSVRRRYRAPVSARPAPPREKVARIPVAMLPMSWLENRRLREFNRGQWG